MTDPALRRDEYLGGRLSIWQPAKGYRAGIDPVLLASACPAEPGQSVLELGCGVGTAALCLAARVPDLDLVGVERQAEMAVLARRNAVDCGARVEIFEADLTQLPPELRQRSFDHVIVNPPYFLRDRSHSSPHSAREAAMGEETALADWIAVAARRLAPKGWLTMIHRPERLGNILGNFAGLGSVQIQPLLPREGRDANLIVLRARKGGRAPLRLHAPVILHQGRMHEFDGDDYRPEISRLLRDGAPFPGLGAAI
ncbi:tRNA1(Val) (adenine(37)-N6)-methyltransferase [Aliiruegeria sabulilitoris]|uniref:tRNA1(Val) (adenine(37)-N6)-methyltransferase n=1 Tax=Aliiruegeria sabulilitoris TaxID=1510458 RepID=UPI000A605D76